MRRWPDSLPDPFTPESDEAAPDGVLRSDFEIGSRARLLTRAAPRLVTLSAVLSGAQKSALDAWWADASWSLAGSSDSLSGWTRTGFDLEAQAAPGPDTVLSDVLVLDASTGQHRVRRTLAAEGWGADDFCALVLSARVTVASRLRAGVVGRDGTLRGAQFALDVPAVLSADAGVAARIEEHRGWARVTVSAPVGSGASAPQAHVGLLSPDGDASWSGSGQLQVAQLTVRRDDGAAVFVPTGADGRAQGAGHGAAWWLCRVLSGHRYEWREVRAAGRLEAQPLPGLNWRVSLPVQVRHA